MRLIHNAFIAVSVAAISTVAAAQTMPPSSTTTTTTTTQQPMPDEPTTTSPSTTAPGQMQTTPGQTQATPGAASQATPAQTGATPSGQTVAATAADLKSGTSVYDQKGGLVGKIDSVSSAGAVLNTGTVRATIPATSFAKNDKGLVISMTKAEIDAEGKKASPKGK